MSHPLPATVTAIHGFPSPGVSLKDYQLILLFGTGELRHAGGQRLQPGTLLFLSPFARERVQAEADCDVLYAVIDAPFLEEMIGAPTGVWYCIQPEQGGPAAERLMELFDLRYNQKPESELPLWQTLFSLLGALDATMKKQSQPQKSDGEDSDRHEKMRRYMEDNYLRPIQLADLAACCGLSRQHASAWFHREFHLSFSEYLTQLRLEEAVRQLLRTEASVTAVSALSGFPNLKAFRQAFSRRYGMLPGAYRTAQKRRMDELLAEPDLKTLQAVNQLMKPYRLIYGKSDQTVHISSTFDGTKYVPTKPVWQDILNIDNSVSCMQLSVREELRKTQQTLKFRYARLGNVFCKDLTPYIPSERQHRFTQFIDLISFLREIGLTPMLELGGSFEVERHGVVATGGGYSVAEKDWLEALEHMLQMAVHYWGKSWPSTWRFEFLMPETLYGDDDPETFLTLFARSVQLIRRYLPAAWIGGPAMPMDSAHAARWEAWLAGVGTRKIPVDFVSMELWADYSVKTEAYPGQHGEAISHLSVDTVDSADDVLIFQKVTTLRQKMEQYGLSGKKLCVAAVGTTKYQAGAAQIGGHCGAFLIKAAMELSRIADSIGCWKFWNDEVEYPDEFQPIGNGCGLISRYGLKNINWYAQNMLTQVYPYLVERGLNSLVTTDGAGRFAVLLHNAKTYSAYFCRHYLDESGRDYRSEKLYASRSAMQQSLAITGVFPGQYRVKQYLIGDHHGLLAAVVQQFGDFYRWTAEEIQYLSGQSLPYQHIYQVEASESLSLNVMLQPNEAMLLMIEPEINQ